MASEDILPVGYFGSTHEPLKPGKVLKVGIDVDDVVADLITAWINRYNVKHGTMFTRHDLTQWELWNDLGCTKNEIFSFLTPDIYDTEVQPIEGAVQAVKDIQKLGHKVVFVSACHKPDRLPGKSDWLTRHFGQDRPWLIVTGETFEHKTKATVGVDWLIDDHIGNLQDFPGFRILVTQPHNRNHIFCGKRVKHLRDVLPLLRYANEVDQEAAIYASAVNARVAAAELENADNAVLTSVNPSIDPALTQQFQVVPAQLQAIRQFATGATRDVDTDKLDYEAFLSPVVLERYAQFMHKNRFQKDGSIRAGDNWQKGIPTEAYMKSLLRHVFTVWLAYRKGQPLPQEEACAILFNTYGLLFEDLKGTPGT